MTPSDDASYGDSSVWDSRFKREGDLDWGGLWIDPFVDTLAESICSKVLDLGCGSGNDVRRLAELGFQVTGLDFSKIALDIARSKRNPRAGYVRADMGRGLPFLKRCFDAVFSNVALHMFDDMITRAVIQEVKRILRPSGIFIFHVNSVDDRELRAHRRRVTEKLGPNRVREADGQTVRFFSQSELEGHFREWTHLKIEHLFVPDRITGDPFKAVWRGCARN
ncbi:MAG: class I SAM-dependent methyltransferase [Gemmatimonadota bacterium]|nr:class I SAM-dependent methyltransferase [Gemmatimonadota bacterium]